MVGALARRSGLERLLRPRHIATLGGRWAEAVIRQARDLGFEGPIWPVHPRHERLGGERAYRAIEDLPRPPDATFIAIDPSRTLRAVADLRARGAGGAVCFAAGFGETGPDGQVLQDALAEAAGPLPLLGPNCYGFINYLDRVSLWPDRHGGRPLERGVAILSQSGNIALNLTMQRRGLPLAMMIAIGNQACLDFGALIPALTADPRISAIGLVIEHPGDPDAFAAAAELARATNTPIVALKLGASDAGARLALSHTAALASGEDVFAAWCRRLGIALVDSLPALLETLKLLHAFGPLAGADIVTLSSSGGEAALLADLSRRHALNFRPFTPAQKAAVSGTVRPLVAVANPFDYHTFDWADGPALRKTFAAVLAARFDFAMLVLDVPPQDCGDGADWLVALDAFAAAAADTAAPAAVLSSLPETRPDKSPVPALAGFDEALRAVAAAAGIGRAWRAPAPPRRIAGPNAGEPLTWDEAAAKAFLARAGIAVPPSRIVRDAEAAAAAGAELGYPLVAKALAADLAHKSERGAVRLGLVDQAGLRRAAADLLTMADAVLIERQIADAVAELILGIARDPVVGLHLVIGAGGVLTNLIADRAILIPPFDAADVAEALAGLRIAALLDGYRGAPAGDRAALIDAALALGAVLRAEAARLVELDINPLLVRPRGRGVVAVDALIRMLEEPPS